MKKILFLFISLILVFTLTSCSMDEISEKIEDFIDSIFGSEKSEECQHIFSDWTGDIVDCVEPFEGERTCKLCGYVEKETVYLDTHKIVKHEGKEPTCTSEGYTEEVYCERCGKVYSEKITLEKIEHKFVNNKCEVCGLESLTVYVDGVLKNAIPDGNNYVAYIIPENEDISLQYDYTNKKIADTKGVEKYSLYLYKVTKLYENIDDMVNSNDSFSEGIIIGTKSYFKNSNRGGSLYKISKTAGAYSKRLKSGLYANLIPFTIESAKIVTVDMFGAKGNGIDGDQAAIIKAFEFTEANEVHFESDTYIQTAAIKVSNLIGKTINGRGAVIKNKYSGSEKIGDDVVFTSCQSLRIINLEIYCSETKGQGTLYKNADHLQLRIKSSKNVTLDNIKITAPNNSSEDRHIGSIWITDSNNVTLKNSRIVNLSNSTQNSAGVWVSAAEGGSCSGFNIYNNYIEKNTHDEVLAFFIGTISDIEIYNNEIYTHDEPLNSPSAHAVGFGVNAIATTVKNVKFYNNKLDVVSSKDAVHFGTVENVDIYGNEIILRNLSASQILEQGLFRVSEPNSTTQTNVNIHDNDLKIVSTAQLKNNYNIGNIFCNLRSGFSIYKNKINAQGTVKKIVEGSSGARILNNTFDFVKAPLNETVLDTSNITNW